MASDYTGSGKSLLFTLPPLLVSSKITIVIVPFVALAEDLYKRAKQLYINVEKWSDSQDSTGMSPWTKLVIVTTDAAVGDRFRNFLSAKEAGCELERIVFDECHIRLTNDDFRPMLVQLARLRSFRTQTIYLTATMPPSMLGLFKQVFQVPRVFVERSPTRRDNIEYKVHIVNKQHDFLRFVRDIVVNNHPRDSKGVVFAKSVDLAIKLAEHLGCPYYHAKKQGGAITINDWLDGKIPLICSTSALGTGMDVDDIRFVIHVDIPYSMIDFAQESGRAGRDGAKATSYVVVQAFDIRRLETNLSNNHGQDYYTTKGQFALLEYIKTKYCRRIGLGEYLDGIGYECIASPCASCDNCQRTTTLVSAPSSSSIWTSISSITSNPPSSLSTSESNLPLSLPTLPTFNPTSSLPTSTRPEASNNSGFSSTPYPGSVDVREQPTALSSQAYFLGRSPSGTQLSQSSAATAPVTYSTQDSQISTSPVDVILDGLELLADKCPKCLVAQRQYIRHELKGCSFDNTSFNYSVFKHLKGLVSWPPYACCYKCACPQEICPRYNNNGKCDYTDILLSTAIAVGCGQNEMTLTVCKDAGLHYNKDKNTLKELAQWLSEPRRLQGIRSTNAVYLFYRFIMSLDKATL